MELSCERISTLGGKGTLDVSISALSKPSDLVPAVFLRRRQGFRGTLEPHSATMRSLRAAQSLASRSLLLSVRALHSAASPAGANARCCSLPVLPTRSPSPSSSAVPTGVAGVVSFSLTFASVAAAEAKAKERPPTDLLPQNVVLYQYQACPFCNKVRGESIWSVLHSHVLFSVLNMLTNFAFQSIKRFQSFLL